MRAIKTPDRRRTNHWRTVSSHCCVEHPWYKEH